MPRYSSNPEKKLTIIGAGIIGFLEAYYAYLAASRRGESLRVTMYDKNPTPAGTTTFHIAPSLTPDEILSVVPRGTALIEKLKLLFSEPGGIRVDDVPGVNDSESAKAFIAAVEAYGLDEEGHRARTEVLLSLGKMSMELWQAIYDNSDDELKKILKDSNFHPCHEPKMLERQRHDGYRIDLIYRVPNAVDRAQGMKSDYEKLGYNACAILSPDEVIKLDPALENFCKQHSTVNSEGVRTWNDDAAALWRPGGCLDTHTFLPKFSAYLEKIMGTYVNDNGAEKNCFRVKYDRPVNEIVYDGASGNRISGLGFFDKQKLNNRYQTSDYVFCPGENVSALKELDLQTPAYAGFAGPSLNLRIALSPEQKSQITESFNHYMEVHQEGVVLAWQARLVGDEIRIAVAGTKAFYGDKHPDVNEAFAKERNLLQLNIINDVVPQLISIALGRDTHGIKLTASDLESLEQKEIARRWVGVRAVAYDGFPTAGQAHNSAGLIENARVTTHCGSGGVSFAPAVVSTSQASMFRSPISPIKKTVLEYGSSERGFEVR